MAREKDGHALLPVQSRYEFVDLTLTSGIQPQRGFIEKQYPGSVTHGPAYPEPLAHAAGVAAYGCLRPSREPHCRQKFSGSGASPPYPVEAPEVLQILLAGHPAIVSLTLRQHPNDAFDHSGMAGRIHSRHHCPAGGRGQKSREEADGGRLTSPVRPEKAEDVPLFYYQREVVHGPA